MAPRIRFFVLSLFVIGLSIAAGCGGSSQVGLQSTGRANLYEPGLPNFDMEAIGLWRSGHPGIEVHVGIPYRSLTFVKARGGFVAAFSTSLQAQRGDDDKQVLEEEWADTVRAGDYESTQRFNAYAFTKRVEIDTGVYRLDVTIRDQTTNKLRTRSQGVRVFPLQSGRPQLSRLWLEAVADSDESKPVVALHLPSNIGALKSVSILYNASQVHQVASQLVVMKLASDTSVATPPYGFASTEASMVYMGIDYSHRDTVFVQRQMIGQPVQEMPIEFRLPRLAKGIYLLEEKVLAHWVSEPADSILLRERYELAINDANFPRPSTLDELIDPLKYLAKEDELKTLASASTPQERRRQFELFWLKLGRNEQGAANLIRQYYTRVQEANLFFTTYKEGWKTDRGMIYIVLGPPLSIASRLTQEYWYYSYDEQDVLSTFLFERVASTNPPSFFATYLPQRRPYYSTMWDRTIERWRSGVVQ